MIGFSLTWLNLHRYKLAKTAAEIDFNDFNLRIDIPSQILHDQGGEFQNFLYNHLVKLYDIKQLKQLPTI